MRNFTNALNDTLMLRSARRARLEPRRVPMQPRLGTLKSAEPHTGIVRRW